MRSLRSMAALVVLACLTVPANAHASPESQLSTRISLLTVAPERASGYRRHLFPHWDLASGSCSVREQVLRDESMVPAAIERRSCKVLSGKWFSSYDGKTLTDPSLVDIDHVVALKEAWDSGAHSWSESRRRAFANDLSDPRSLAAVSSSSNRSKSDKDPSQWLPVAAARCEYLSAWVEIKLRWSLSVDRSELASITAHASRCYSPITPPPTPSPSSLPPAAVSPPGTSPYYPSCAAARAAGAAPLRRGTPGYRPGLDGDGDGVACE